MFLPVHNIANTHLLESYLRSRDRHSRSLYGSWSGSFTSLTTAVWRFSTTPVLLVSVYQRLIWDKYFHPGHISFPTSQCACGQDYSLAHILCHCSLPTLLALRQGAFAKLQQFVQERPNDNTSVFLSYFTPLLTSNSPHTLRYWLSLWNEECLQTILQFPLFAQLTVPQIRTLCKSLLPHLQHLANISLKLWSTWLLNVATPFIAPAYTTPRLHRMQSMHRFLATSASTQRYSLLRASDPLPCTATVDKDTQNRIRTSQRSLPHFFQPIVPLPEEPSSSFDPNGVPLDTLPEHLHSPQMFSTLLLPADSDPLPRLIASPPSTPTDSPEQHTLDVTKTASPQPPPPPNAMKRFLPESAASSLVKRPKSCRAPPSRCSVSHCTAPRGMQLISSFLRPLTSSSDLQSPNPTRYSFTDNDNFHSLPPASALPSSSSSLPITSIASDSLSPVHSTLFSLLPNNFSTGPSDSPPAVTPRHGIG